MGERAHAQPLGEKGKGEEREVRTMEAHRMIPCIAIPVLNRKDLLRRCVDSIDFPTEVLFIINNGELDLNEFGLPLSIISMREHNAHQNYGVAGSWNLAMDLAFNQRGFDCVLIVGSDLVWAPGDLKLFWDTYVNFPNADFILGNHSFSNFMIKRSGFEKCGWFWEECYPGYFEDSDMWQRVRRTDTKCVNVSGLWATHEGSATIKSDPAFKRLCDARFAAMAHKYAEKWGCPVGSAAQETFTTPYNRGGSVKEWSLSPQRLGEPHFRAHG